MANRYIAVEFAGLWAVQDTLTGTLTEASIDTQADAEDLARVFNANESEDSESCTDSN